MRNIARVVAELRNAITPLYIAVCEIAERKVPTDDEVKDATESAGRVRALLDELSIGAPTPATIHWIPVRTSIAACGKDSIIDRTVVGPCEVAGTEAFAAVLAIGVLNPEIEACEECARAYYLERTGGVDLRKTPDIDLLANVKRAKGG
jgi:hypothetical protein